MKNLGYSNLRWFWGVRAKVCRGQGWPINVRFTMNWGTQGPGGVGHQTTPLRPCPTWSQVVFFLFLLWLFSNSQPVCWQLSSTRRLWEDHFNTVSIQCSIDGFWPVWRTLVPLMRPLIMVLIMWRAWGTCLWMCDRLPKLIWALVLSYVALLQVQKHLCG